MWPHGVGRGSANCLCLTLCKDAKKHRSKFPKRTVIRSFGGVELSSRRLKIFRDRYRTKTENLGYDVLWRPSAILLLPATDHSRVAAR
jgi:hypothetical protein